MIRQSIVAEAQTWLHTPYVHQASEKGAGCDCLGLLRGVWRAVIGDEPELPPPYTPDWADGDDGDALLRAAQRWLTPIDLDHANAGDVLLFRMAPGASAKHCAIVMPHERIIHAYWGRAVVISRLGSWWRVRSCAAFCFPGVE